MKNKIIFLHGFASSSDSNKATLLRENYIDDVITPDLTSKPEIDFKIIEGILKKHPDSILVGSSFGGFYTEYFSRKYNLKALFINPLVDVKLAKDLIGKHNYFNNNKEFMFTKSDYTYLEKKKLELNNFKKCSCKRTILVSKDDTVLNYVISKQYFISKTDELLIFDNEGHNFNNFSHILKHLNFLILI